MLCKSWTVFIFNDDTKFCLLYATKIILQINFAIEKFSKSGIKAQDNRLQDKNIARACRHLILVINICFADSNACVFCKIFSPELKWIPLRLRTFARSRTVLYDEGQVKALFLGVFQGLLIV